MCLFSLLLVSSCMTCTMTHTRTNKWREKKNCFKEQTLHAALQAIHPEPLFDTVSFQHRNTTLNGTSKQWWWTKYWELRKTSVRHHILATTGKTHGDSYDNLKQRYLHFIPWWTMWAGVGGKSHHLQWDEEDRSETCCRVYPVSPPAFFPAQGLPQ